MICCPTESFGLDMILGHSMKTEIVKKVVVAGRYSMVYSGLTGKPFYTSYVRVGDLLKRQDLIMPETMYTIEMVFNSASWVVCLGSMLDALVVCYAADLESGNCHSNRVEQALAFI
ncbi:hypothetical protein AYI68_g4950 [Smittium mucronatum]|uniref:Uncharacterized protein n=1 Tax=Smittium mucronatum TaxID=133383 RepID=A0A1R0GVQ0_9FUNG|nr:hypothetical protein AYI68_g4950 [Smittium mucronatum]